jgi:hypothetical protein
MLREHDGKIQVQENGYWYPAEYICRMADEGATLFFKTDQEWIDYFAIRAIVELNEEGDRGW